MNSYARKESRVQALEARAGSGVDYAAIDRRHAELLALINSVFPVDPRRSRMDDLARLCGLPNSRYMKAVLYDKFSEAAFQAAAQNAYGDDWREPMKATMDRALDQIGEVLGDDWLEQTARAFPPVLTAARMACGASAEAAA